MHTPLPLFDVAALRKVEAQACTALGGDEFELMRRAGQAAWRYALEHWPQARRIVVACGPGNNGGDGYILARLAHAAGRVVQVLAAADAMPASADCKRAAEAWRAAGGVTRPFDGTLPEADLYVDALFGIGLSRAVSGAAQAIIERINASRRPVLALDVPSGLDVDRGHAERVCIVASATLAML